MRRLLRRALYAHCAILVLSGCSGGSVALRSGFPPPPASAGATASVQISGGGGLAFAVVLGAAIAAAVQETTQSRLHSPSRSWVDEPSRPWWQPIDRGWVDRGPEKKRNPRVAFETTCMEEDAKRVQELSVCREGG